MNEKWSALVNAPVPPPASVAPVLTADILEKSTSNVVPMTVAFFLLAVTAIVIVSVILSKSRTQRPQKLAVPKLVAPKVAEEPERPQDAAVEAKAAGGETEVGATAFLEANGLTFDDFQNAFQHGREKPVVDAPTGNSKAYMHVLDELEALKPTLAAQGQTFQDYIDAHNMKVPDALLDLWTSGPTAADPGAALEWPPEAMMLAREALQPVSASMDPEAAAVILREILAARTEAARMDLKLPPLPSDQEAGLRHWAKSVTTAGALAKNILSRF